MNILVDTLGHTVSYSLSYIEPDLLRLTFREVKTFHHPVETIFEISPSALSTLADVINDVLCR